MSQLAAIDLVFLLLENQTRPMHMSSCLVLQPPAGEGKTFVARLLKAFRAAEPGKPFNQKVKWLEGGLAHWEPAIPDPLYHVRHVAIKKTAAKRTAAKKAATKKNPARTTRKKAPVARRAKARAVPKNRSSVS